MHVVLGCDVWLGEFQTVELTRHLEQRTGAVGMVWEDVAGDLMRQLHLPLHVQAHCLK